MRLLGDYHTHTIYSKSNHGKSTVLENALVAKQKGLKEIAITDHGYSHIFYGVKKSRIENLKNDIKLAKQETNINVLYGIEANILNFKGEIDLDKNSASGMDIVNMGYHALARKHIFNGFFFHYLNYFAKIFKTPKWLKNKNTKAYISALENYNIDVITHLNIGVKVNVIEIAKKCKETNTYIELNGKRIGFSEQDIDEMIKLKVKFLINSDAHISDNVANIKKPMNFAIINKIPKELIYNIDNIPKFKNHKE